MDDRIIENAVVYIQELFRNNAGGHDADHTMRVYRNALVIAESEPDCDRMIVSLSALLHDADDHKLFDTENNENARRFMKDQMNTPEAKRIAEERHKFLENYILELYKEMGEK